MAYQINNTRGDIVATIADGTIDSTLALKLIGKNYAGYGEIQNENFVALLENFASPYEPTRKVGGQIWFDSGNRKLKFFDGTKFRTAGGSETGTVQPSNPTVGDFWWDTGNQQLYAYSETGGTGGTGGFVLVGPQGVAGSATTEMRSKSVRDTLGGTHAVIAAITGGTTIFIISPDDTFTIDNSIPSNQIEGFTKIHQGVTLYSTNDSGITTSAHRYFGTASNSTLLNGFTSDDFAKVDDAQFTRLVQFDDLGYTVGTTGTPKLAVYNESIGSPATLTPIIKNPSGNQIIFQTTLPGGGGATVTPLLFDSRDTLPGENLTSNLGSPTKKFSYVYAGTFSGTATRADTLSLGGNYVTASAAAVASSVAGRDGNGNLVANLFQGIATSANYADLAENYLADGEYEVGTVLMIGGEKEVTPCQVGFRAVGPVSDKPAHLMNSGLEGGTAVALKGRVPVKVTGAVIKGQRLVAGPDGTAQAAFGNNADVFAIALASSNEPGVSIVECLIL